MSSSPCARGGKHRNAGYPASDTMAECAGYSGMRGAHEPKPPRRRARHRSARDPACAICADRVRPAPRAAQGGAKYCALSGSCGLWLGWTCGAAAPLSAWDRQTAPGTSPGPGCQPSPKCASNTTSGTRAQFLRGCRGSARGPLTDRPCCMVRHQLDAAVPTTTASRSESTLRALSPGLRPPP